MNGGRCCDESVTQLDAVALRELTEVVPSLLSDRCVDGDAVDCREEAVQQVVVSRSRAVPKLSHGDRRTEECRVALGKAIPAGEESAVPSPANLNQDIGVDEYGLQEAIRLSRDPLRRRRT